MTLHQLPRHEALLDPDTADTGAILDGLYAAVADAGVFHGEAQATLRIARQSQDLRMLMAAEDDLRDAVHRLRLSSDAYRIALYSLPAGVRADYLRTRHPYLDQA